MPVTWPRARRDPRRRVENFPHFTGIFANSRPPSLRACKWHAACCVCRADTGVAARLTATGKDSRVRGRVFEGEEDPRTRAIDGQSAPPSAQRVARVTPSRSVAAGSSGDLVTQGSYPVPLQFGFRERGESNSRQPRFGSQQAVPVHSSSQKNQIRPVNEAGRAVGFIPVTPCSFGKRQPEGWSNPSGSAAFSIFPASRGAILTLARGRT